MSDLFATESIRRPKTKSKRDSSLEKRESHNQDLASTTQKEQTPEKMFPESSVRERVARTSSGHSVKDKLRSVVDENEERPVVSKYPERIHDKYKMYGMNMDESDMEVVEGLCSLLNKNIRKMNLNRFTKSTALRVSSRILIDTIDRALEKNKQSDLFGIKTEDDLYNFLAKELRLDK